MAHQLLPPLPHLRLELALHLLLELIQPVQLVVGSMHQPLLLGLLPLLQNVQLDERVVRLQLAERSVSSKAVDRTGLP